MKQAFLFPGQGSQKVGMGSELFDKFDIAKKRFEEANEILGRDIRDLCFNGPAEQLTETRNTQPALYVVEAIIFDILKNSSSKPSYTLGHSMGEYSALYASGFLTFSDGLKIISKRGELMAGAGESAPGTMAAVIGLTLDEIRIVLNDIEGTVVTANENSPEQIVISGDVSAVKDAQEKLKAAGAKRVVPLNVSGAFHSPLMKPVKEKFSEFIKDFEMAEPEYPIIANVTGEPVTDPVKMKSLMVEQLVSPVRWIDSMNFLLRENITAGIEAGPGSVLKGLARKCSPKLKIISYRAADNLFSL